MFNIKKDEKGFTLIELMVVIAVLGILAGIAVPRFSGFRDRATLSEGESALGTIQNAMEMYFMDEGGFPTNSNLTGTIKSNSDEYASDDLFGPDYLGQYVDVELSDDWSFYDYNDNFTTNVNAVEVGDNEGYYVTDNNTQYAIALENTGVDSHFIILDPNNLIQDVNDVSSTDTIDRISKPE